MKDAGRTEPLYYVVTFQLLENNTIQTCRPIISHLGWLGAFNITKQLLVAK